MRIYEPFIHMIAEKAIIPPEKSLRMLAEKSRLGYLPLDKYDLDVETARAFPKDLCQRWCVLPFDRMSKSILIATANPFNKYAAEELQSATQNRILWYLAPPADLIKGIKRIYR